MKRIDHQLRGVARLGLALASLTLIACFGGSEDRPSSVLSYYGVYNALSGADVHIHESGTEQTDANRFSAGGAKDLVGQRNYTASDSILLRYVVTRPGVSLDDVELVITRDAFFDVRDGLRRIRVEFDGESLSATLENIP